MLLLMLFAFLGGVITILSPCILPILPIVLSGGVGGGKSKPRGIIIGFVLSFTFFTLFLASIVRSTGLSADTLRAFSVVVVFLFGISLLVPQYQILSEKLFSKLSSRINFTSSKEGFLGGLIVGLSIGLIWTPCVGPILASVITLAATSEVNLAAFLITISYSIGTAIPMLIVMKGGRKLLQKNSWLLSNTQKIQKAFGILMILTAIGIFFNIDRRFQAYILEKFPQYGVGLTSLEDNSFIKRQLEIFMNDDSSSKFDSSNINNNGGSFSNDLKNNKIKAPELIEGGEWFNSDPLIIKELRGKVVLLDFWTYSCINCQRTFPYLRDWDKKYKDMGLVIIGVHSPEFEFEKNPENVQKAIDDFELRYPVIQDNNFATWRSYSNRYWPAKYIIDKDGFVRYYHAGEGAYSETENVIQELLKETGKVIAVDIKNDTQKVRSSNISHETYLGYERMEYLMGSGNIGFGEHTFTLSKNISHNKFSFGGIWNITRESAIAQDDAVIEYNFNADKVFLVMNPSDVDMGQPTGTVKVFLNNKLVGVKNAGKDVKNGIISVDSDRLYELIDTKGNSGNYLLRLEFSPGISAFAFTFG